MTQLQNLWKFQKTISIKSLFEFISNKFKELYQKIYPSQIYPSHKLFIIRKQPPQTLGKPPKTEGGSTK
ncbi:MAG: hypothetical protein QNJ47_21175 [Nostocaceae cyanobacterium]|nr:hypothetical protein [Nostocaceae cyanobacterium]